MIRTLSLAVLAACVAVPAFAADNTDSNSASDVQLVQNNRRDSRSSRPAAPPGAPAGARPIGNTLSPYPLYERRMGNRFWRAGYMLTPLDYYRLRAGGFTQDEAFMIANATRITGLDIGVFKQAVYNGMYARAIGYEYGINPKELTRVMPEWKTQAWADATHESVYTKDKLNVFY